MTYFQAQRLVTIVIFVGGLGLCAIAARAAFQGVWSAALFIAPLGLILVGTAIWGALQLRRLAHRTLAPRPPAD
jgi:hypothetical protein